MLLLLLHVATSFQSHLLAPAQLFSCPGMLTLDIYMLIHALSATEACNPTRLQLIVQDYNQCVIPKSQFHEIRRILAYNC